MKPPPPCSNPPSFAFVILTAASALFITACSTTSSPQRPSPFAECTPASQIDRPAVIRTGPSPRINPDWYPGGATIRVVYQFEVTPEGKMGRKIHAPAHVDPRILSAIERSFSRWRFQPALRNGQPVTSCFEQPYELIFENQGPTSIPPAQEKMP